MVRPSLRAVPLLAIFVAGCGNAAVPSSKADAATPAVHGYGYGYGGIVLGSSLEQVLSTVDARFYRPQDIAACSSDMPIKGCVLIWSSRAVPFVRKDGIPYNLNLAFNRQGKLESLSLVYASSSDDVSRAECLDLHNRTLGWLTQEYGEFQESPASAKQRRDAPALVIVKDGSSLTDAGKAINISLISSHIVGECRIDVGFNDYPAPISLK